MRYQFIHDHRQEYPVKKMCHMLQVSRSGYYDWIDRPASARRLRQEALVVEIRRVHAQSRQLYGSPRVWAELRGQRVNCCQNTVARLMQRSGVRSRIRRRFVAQTTDSRHH